MNIQAGTNGLRYCILPAKWECQLRISAFAVRIVSIHFMYKRMISDTTLLFSNVVNPSDANYSAPNLLVYLHCKHGAYCNLVWQQDE